MNVARANQGKQIPGELLNVAGTQNVWEALSAVFPADPTKQESEQAVQITADKEKNALTVHCREDTMVAVRAIVSRRACTGKPRSTRDLRLPSA